MIDLDALRGEAAQTPKELRLDGQTFTLPAELPGDVLAPFLASDLGLIEVIAEALNGNDEDAMSDLIFDALAKKPTLPSALLEAAANALRSLLGDQYEAFVALRPSVPTYMLLGRALFEEYGMSLGDFFGSGSSSDNEDETSKQTSPTTTPEPTSETSLPAPTDGPAPSEFAD